MTLTSFPEGFRAAVFGATGGIGAAIVDRLSTDPRAGMVYAGGRRPALGREKVTPFPFDLTDEASIAAAAARLDGPLHLVFVATGVLHDEAMVPEKTWRSLDAAAMARAFQINATGPALIAKHTLGRLARGERAVFAALSARVGSIGDNRLGGWHAYRASKAALNMIVRTLAVELERSHPGAIAVALHPGTVDTPLSRPFQRGVPPEKLFAPAFSAGKLMETIDALSPAHSGTLRAWDGAEIPF